jgi:pimeloyl-ACP methyl ester carboxylesterase
MRVHGRVNERALAHDGREVVFVHGLGMSTSYMEPTMRIMARDFAVSALDLPGFGRSRLPGRLLSLAELGDALAGWLRARGIVSPILVGNSHGCQVIVESVARSSVRPAALVLNAPTMDAARRSAFGEMMRVIIDAPREPLALVSHVVRDYWRAGLRRVLFTFGEALSDRIEDDLSRLDIPTSIICGARDPVSPPSWGLRLAEAAWRPDRTAEMTFRTIPAVAHAMPFTHPLELATEIRALAERLEGIRSRA